MAAFSQPEGTDQSEEDIEDQFDFSSIPPEFIKELSVAEFIEQNGHGLPQAFIEDLKKLDPNRVKKFIDLEELVKYMPDHPLSQQTIRARNMLMAELMYDLTPYPNGLINDYRRAKIINVALSFMPGIYFAFGMDKVYDFINQSGLNNQSLQTLPENQKWATVFSILIANLSIHLYGKVQLRKMFNAEAHRYYENASLEIQKKYEL